MVSQHGRQEASAAQKTEFIFAVMLDRWSIGKEKQTKKDKLEKQFSAANKRLSAIEAELTKDPEE